MNMMSKILDSKHYMKALLFARLRISIDLSQPKELMQLITVRLTAKKKNNKKLENKK